MRNKCIATTLLLLLLSITLIDTQCIAEASCMQTSNPAANRINVDLVQRYITQVETSNNDITYYMESIFNIPVSEEDKLQVTEALQERIRLLEVDIVDLNRNIKIEDYNCKTCQLLTTLSISLLHNKNALNELLAYLNAQDNNARFESLERFFFAKTSSYQNLDWVKRILAEYN